MKFKVGDEVKFEGNTYKVKWIPGMPEYDRRGFSDAKRGLVLKDEYCERWAYQDNCELVIKTLSNLEVGDIVLDNEGDERFVMAVYGKIVTLSDDEKEAENYCYCDEYTVKELENEGFKVKQEVEEDETIEIEGTKYKASEIKDALKKAKK